MKASRLYTLLMFILVVLLSTLLSVGYMKYSEHKQEEEQKKEMARFFGLSPQGQTS